MPKRRRRSRRRIRVVIFDFGKRRALVVDRPIRHRGALLSPTDRNARLRGRRVRCPGQREGDRSAVDLRLSVLPCDPGAADGFRRRLRLDAAHRLVASATATTSTPYWKPAFVENDRRSARRAEGRVPRPRPERRRRGSREASTACFLSGGTDSSTVAGMLTQVTRRAGARLFDRLRRRGLRRNGVCADRGAPFRARAPRVLRHARRSGRRHSAIAASLDQPFGNSSVLPAYFCALRARDDGFTRMLAGDGGDELFGGNSRYAMQNVFELYDALPRVFDKRSEPVATGRPLFRRVPGLRQLAAMCAMRARRCPTGSMRSICCDASGSRSARTRFRAAIDVATPFRQQRATGSAPTRRSLINRMLAYDWKFTLADNDLPKVRRPSQLGGHDCRLSVSEPRLIDFSLSFHPLEAEGIHAALVLQGSPARLPAGRDPAQEKARLRIAVRTWMCGTAAPRARRDALHGIARAESCAAFAHDCWPSDCRRRPASTASWSGS